MSSVQLLLCFLLAISRSPALGQRPTNKEWKEKRAAEDASKASAAADQSKMAAVDKVVTLLEDLQGKVLSDGEEEAASYNKFACFCKDGQREKTKTIKEGKDEKDSLIAAINKLADGRKADDKTITGLEKDIKTLNDDMGTETADNAKEVGKHAAEAADLSGAISGIEDAMKSLKATKPSLLQLRSASDNLQSALAMADALGLADVDALQGAATAMLQQAPGVEMENYKFHSGGVIDMLEKLLKTFRGKKNTADSTEVKRMQEHQMLMQTKTDTVTAKTLETANTQKSRDDKISNIAESSQSLTTTSANLLDDKAYLNELYSLCNGKAKTWDQRSQVRADELSAITAAITIVKGAVSEKTSKGSLRLAQSGVSVKLVEVLAHDEDALESMEADAETQEDSRPSSFLQRRMSSSPEDSRQVVAKISELFRSKGGQLKSTLLTSLSSQITTTAPKGMEKIKTLITELIKRLQAEASNEATQKGWCDKSTTEANQKKVSASATITELNDSLAELEADRSLLKEALAKLTDEIKELKDAQTEADNLRKEEKTENANTVKEAKAGQTAVEEAIGILDKFYKDAAKEKVAFAQSAKGPADDAPDAGFKNDEAYKGAQAGGEGVLGMLEVIKSDFVRTVKETEKSETEAGNDHTAFTDTTTTSKKEKEAAETAKKK